MKKKTMYVKPLMEVIHVEENLLSGASMKGNAGGTGNSGNTGKDIGGGPEGKGFFWQEDEGTDDPESDNLFTGRSPWDGFYRN